VFTAHASQDQECFVMETSCFARGCPLNSQAVLSGGKSRIFLDCGTPKQMSTFTPKADIRGCGWNVRFVPEADIDGIVALKKLARGASKRIAHAYFTKCLSRKSRVQA
jgi:hypothetical protein